MILVYDYMAGGTLADHLYKHPRESIKCFLTWKQLLKICIRAGRGLDYLHTGHGVIHCDVKASNILLDENLVAKVSDFGLAKWEDRSKSQSTKVNGIFGYFDPYYFTTHKLTRKSDIYALRVVLLEVLWGIPAVDSGVSEDERILTTWARDKISKGEVDQIVASSLQEEISPNSLKTFVGLAERCLHDEPKNRPTMSQVVLQLEFALEQQDSRQNLILNERANVSDDIRPGDDETDVSLKTSRMASTTSPPIEQNDSKLGSAHQVLSGRKRGRKATTRKPARPWPWGAFWNRAKPSKKSELLLSETYEANKNVVKFDWDKIAAAINNLSSSKIVGHGGFGLVYMAVLPTGQVVAVKRHHSPSSTQGLEEFKNEILLLRNLQHQNIIKLLGYCIHREEKLLAYEFMENKSLDNFIDEGQRLRLLWTVRFKIIMGIARGLIYLHHDSGLKVIYRDLIFRNILLDSDMNPKITDFGFACLCWNYMPPEYIMTGKFSVKSDVYSFGIIVMEIVSGRRARNSSYSETYMFLPRHSWKLWNEANPLSLVNNLLEGEFSADEVLRCIQVGHLCTQQDPNYRPEMPSVLKILEGEKPQVELRVMQEDRENSSEHTDELISNTICELDDTLER